ncbi:SMP-30/gluconolactonase/LRE family protein [Pedobacter cryophilus]|uniref:ATP-binding protein n=1 Tax=Pedobacter cryophilus TaxID=2571271 RepID=A0A4U1C3U9_9SPHI|nr:ATP-binding protein [Pedobacter cryophilus]TKC00500.1 ATP-binding protein [Pedobacter cryophilus]
MKNSLILCFLLFVVTANAQVTLTKLWETTDLPTPESVLPTKNGKSLYVSLIDGDAAKADGKGGIAILSEDGKIINKNWVTGLNAPKGMGIYKGKLYVADLNEVVVIEVKAGKITNKIPVEGTVFLNDIAIDAKGGVYVSDTRLGHIYKIENNKVALYLDKMTNANGLKVVGDNLFILSGPTLLKVDAERKITTIAKGLASGGDGIEPIAANTFLVSCWVGLVYEVKMDGTVTQLMDTRKQKINTADLGYNAQKKTAYIPTFFKNSVIAYQLK